jgi:hypothetical protein
MDSPNAKANTMTGIRASIAPNAVKPSREAIQTLTGASLTHPPPHRPL